MADYSMADYSAADVGWNDPVLRGIFLNRLAKHLQNEIAACDVPGYFRSLSYSTQQSAMGVAPARVIPH